MLKLERKFKSYLGDELSMIMDFDDWAKGIGIFRWLDSRRGRHTVDRFATEYNKHLRTFNSRFWVPNTEGVNALSQNWHGENNWVLPPPGLLAEVIGLIKKQGVVATLVVPWWRSALFGLCYVWMGCIWIPG